MKPNNQLFVYCLFLAFVFCYPFNSSAQIERSDLRRVRVSVPELNETNDYSFVFGRGRSSKYKIKVDPENGLFNIKFEWIGSASELRAVLVRTSKRPVELIKVFGKSPLYLTYQFDEEVIRSSSTQEWYVILENPTPQISAKGTAEIFYGGEAIVKPGQELDPAEEVFISYNDFILLDRCNWGDGEKDITEEGKIIIRYPNGNWIKHDWQEIRFFDAEKCIEYKVVKQVVRMEAQTPTEPPSPSLFTGEANGWLQSLELWVEGYNEDLLNEIKTFMENDPELISKYLEVEQRIPKTHFRLMVYRLDVLKDLREIM